MEQYPPPGFTNTESAISGIEIYKPAPVELADHDDLVEFNCPQCGAVTAYSTTDGGLTCSHCGYFEAPKDNAVGKQALEFEFTVETIERASQGWGESRNEIECENCGAKTSLPISNLTNTCVFCGSNRVIQRKAPQDVLRPRYLIPFQIEPLTCQQIYQRWMKSSWMTPSDIRTVGRKVAFQSVYLPFWTFDATVNADWRAEVGHPKRERYFQNGEWKERTVIEWRWESGHVSINIDDLVVKGSARLSKLIVGRVSDYKLEALTPYDPKYLAGLHAQAYEISLEDAWKQGRESMREQSRLACLGEASTKMVRNFSMNLDFSNESWRYVLLPLYLAAYQYKQNQYQVMINGQSGSIAGQRPVDWTKVWLIVVALLLPGVFLGLLGLITLVFGGVGMVIGGVGLFLLIIGIIISLVILKEAYGMDDA